MLPSGDIAGFGARRCDWIADQGESPKYLNSPESPIYDKSSILYGLKEARDEIRKDRRAVLVEGYVDVIGVHQAGVPVAVASCGTALSLRHAAMLKRLAPEIVTLYDGDAAGQDAARKAAEILLKEGMRVRIASLPEGDDPDTFARREGGEAVRRLLDEAPSAIDFFVGRAKKAYTGGGIAGMTQALETVKPLLTAVPDPLERDVSIDAAAKALGIDRAVLRRHLAGHAPSPPPPRPHQAESKPPVSLPMETFEVEILKLLTESAESVVKALDAYDATRAFSHPAIQAAVDAGVEAYRSGTQFDAPRALEAASASSAMDERGISILRKTLMEPLPERHSLEVCVKRLLKKKNAIRLRHLQQLAARETDPDKLVELAKEVDQLNRILASLT
jgi:DNA primase